MKIVYACQALPPADQPTRAIFLAGPTPREHTPADSWRPRALEILRALGHAGHVFIPEADGGGWHGDYEAQVRWEWSALGRADVIIFWIPRDLEGLPGFTTNIEFGFLAATRPGRLVVGFPEGAPKTRYIRTVCGAFPEFSAALALRCEETSPALVSTLDDAVRAALSRLAASP